MKEVFGDMLAVDPEKMGDVLPSPDALKYKILAKGKALHHTSEEEESSDEEAVPETPIEPTSPIEGSAPLISSSDSVKSGTATSDSLAVAPKSKVKVKIDPEFSKTIYLRGNHFKSFEESKSGCF